MTVRSTVHVDPRGQRTLWLLRLSFLLIIAGFLVSNLVVMAAQRSRETADRLLMDNMLTSIELVARLSRDLDQKRFAIDDHVLASTEDEWQPIEEKIAALDDDYARTAAAYEPVVNLEGEGIVWGDLKARVARLVGPVDRVLALSQANQDLEARRMMAELRDEFDAIDTDLRELIRVNRVAAFDAVAHIDRAERESHAVLEAITVPGALLAGIAAFAVTRFARRRDAELTQALWSLETRNRELDAFAGRAAHDLKGPLTAINLSAQRLAGRLPDEAGALGILRRGVTQMSQLINDMLDLSRVGAEVTVGPASTAEAAQTLEQDLAPLVASAGGRLRVEVEPGSVRCAPGLLRQVLWNLGENAVKYRRDDAPPEVEVRGRRIGGRYELKVSDNGRGMDPKEARHVFEPFFRSEQVRDLPGTGLGLSIVQRIVEASGGRLAVLSAPGRGSTFTVNLELD